MTGTYIPAAARIGSFPTTTSPIFTDGEKRGLAGHAFQGVDLDQCEFSVAELRGRCFLRCDFRGTRFRHARFEDNRFDESSYLAASGILESRRTNIQERGGLFLRIVDGKAAPADCGHESQCCKPSDLVRPI